MPIVVKKKPGESDDKLIMKFRKKILMEKFLLSIKDREYYKKPSTRKKERLAELKKNKKRW
jgi:ribosomal protein S21